MYLLRKDIVNYEPITNSDNFKLVADWGYLENNTMLKTTEIDNQV